MRLSLFFVTVMLLVSIAGCDSSGPTQMYKLEVSVSPNEGGSVSPANGEYEEGTEVNINAEPSEGWRFGRWEGVAESVNPATIIMDSDKSITAVFERRDYALTVEIEGEGSVSEKVVQQATAEEDDYPYETTVELTAEPEEGWKFVEWQGDLSGEENPATIIVEEEKSVTAVFERKEYALTIETEGEGNVKEELVSGDEGESGYLFESEVSLTAQPAEEWTFDHWEGDLEGEEDSQTIIIDEEKSVRAVFVRAYTISVDTEGEGSVDADPQIERYPAGTEVEIIATPETGWEFVQWGGDVQEAANPLLITVEQNMNITANFSKIRVSGISLSSETEVLYVDEQIELDATVTPQDAYNKTVIWSSTDPEVATVSDDGLVMGVSAGDVAISATTEDGGYTDEVHLTVEQYYKEVGESYLATDGLTVTLNSLNFTDHESYHAYSISYTLKNNTDRIIDEGSFKMYYEGEEGGVPQYGFFGDLTPGEQVTRSYTWEVEETEVFDVLEYHEDNFFRDEPYENSLKWQVESN